MSVICVPAYITDSTVASGNNDKTGLTPTVLAGYAMTTSAPAITSGNYPTVKEGGNGLYYFFYDPEANGEAAFQIDAGSTLTASSDRFFSIIFTRDSSRIAGGIDSTGHTVLSTAEHTLISGADVPAAMTTQGYTTARAAYLDTLNGLVANIWAASLSALTTSGSIGAKLANWVLGSDNKVLLSANAQTGVTIPTVTNVGTLTTYTGDTPQSGDAYARIGSPAGASVSADIAGVPASTLKYDTSTITGEAKYSPLNALRTIRNKLSISGTTVTVYKEDGATTAFTNTVTTSSSATPITGSTPN